LVVDFTEVSVAVGFALGLPAGLDLGATSLTEVSVLPAALAAALAFIAALRFFTP
jgi:hypothetical protein